MDDKKHAQGNAKGKDMKHISPNGKVTEQITLLKEELNMEEKEFEDFKEGSQFVKVVAGKPLTTTIVEAKKGTTPIEDEKTGNIKQVKCIHIVLDDKRKMTVTGKRLATALKPHILKGLPQKVKISKVGERFDVEYEVESA